VRFRRRARFADLVARQLDLFEEEHASLLRDVRAAERLYDASTREEATERYGDYADLVETGTEILAGLRDAYARTLDEETAAEYEEAFNGTASRRFPALALELGDT
jgi:hypothetical protein